MKKNALCLTRLQLFARVLVFRTRGIVHSFFDGSAYAVCLGGLCIIGHIFAADMITMSLSLLLTGVGILLLHNLLPLVATMMLFIYQISVSNSPASPSFSDYFMSPLRMIPLIALLVFVLLSAVYVMLRYRAPSVNEIAALPGIGASILLAAALMLNGVLSGQWRTESLIFGVVQAIALVAIPYVLIFGLLGISRERLLASFCTVCAVAAAVLVIETVHLYLTGGVVVDGAVDKGRVLFGWGIWTTAGMDMSVLIPILFLGAMRGRAAPIYLILAHLCYTSAVLTLSRNALVFATLSFVLSAIVYSVFGMYGVAYRRAIGVLAMLAVIFSPFYADSVARLLGDYIERGFSDNGRFALWSYGVECFLESPIFGKGFFALKTDTFRAENIFPPMLHNTLVELAAATGAAGLVSYLIFRVRTLFLFLRGITVEKLLLFFSMLTLLAMSLFDNFVFHVQPTFVFSACYAVGYLYPGRGEGELM